MNTIHLQCVKIYNLLYWYNNYCFSNTNLYSTVSIHCNNLKIQNIYLQLLDDVHNVSTRYENPKLENPIRKTTSSTQWPEIQNIIIYYIIEVLTNHLLN